MPRPTSTERRVVVRQASRAPALLALGFVSALSGWASAQDNGADAELSCRPEAAPGRVICELACSAHPGLRLVWLDALVTRTPDFVKPLRSRIAAPRAVGASPAERRLSFALVATRGGPGELAVTARLVLCRGRGQDERCFVESHGTAATLRVGS